MAKPKPFRLTRQDTSLASDISSLKIPAGRQVKPFSIVAPWPLAGQALGNARLLANHFARFAR